MRTARTGRSAICLLFLVRSSAARACTVCHSAAARELQSALFDGTFVHKLLLLILPCAVLLVSVALVYLAMPDLTVADNDCAFKQSHDPHVPLCPRESLRRACGDLA
jgi:hypothetical protein